MFKVIWFEPKHLLRIQINKNQDLPYFKDVDLLELGKAYLDAGPAYTGMASNGDIIGCAGIIKHWKGTGSAWAFISKQADRYPLAVTKAIRKYLNEDHKFSCVMTYVREDDNTAKRWAEILGFKPNPEPIPKYWPDRSTARLFVRVF